MELNRLAQYFTEKERKRLDSSREKSALPEMTLSEIKQSCRENDGYETPELNDKLYLHFRGFKKIENLESFTECKAIWLDSNGFNRIEGLSTMLQLRCLYLGKNLLEKIEGLDTLKQLSILDLSNNRISHIDNLSCCPMLQTLNLSRNALHTALSVEHLALCKSIINVDVTNNLLKGDDVIEVFSRMECLTALSINGNPITQSSGFRKRSIVAIAKLGYLDRPIDAIERHCAAAFVEGGVDAERKARETWIEEEKKKKRDEMAAFRLWQTEQRQRRVVEGAPRVTMTEFTEEEQRQRSEEAERATAAERRMLDLGINRIAQKYWQLEGQMSGRDPLAAAVEAVEQEETRMTAVSEESSISVKGGEGIEISQEGASESVITGHISADTVTVSVEDCDLSSASPMMAEAADQDVVEVEVHLQCDSFTEKDDDSTDEPLDIDIDESFPCDSFDLKSESEQQAIRDQRVAESLRIFYQQKSQKKSSTTLSTPPYDNVLDTNNVVIPAAPPATPTQSIPGHVDTWNDALSFRPPAPAQSPRNDPSRPIYWSEHMDLLLARLVRECAYDFAAIATAMRELVSGDGRSEGSDGVGVVVDVDVDLLKASKRLSADDCRLRWAQLDARNWTETASATASTDVIYKICVQPNVLGKGHGAQPSFDSLMAIAAGSYPEYLRPPTVFPSVSDFDEDEEEEDT